MLEIPWTPHNICPYRNEDCKLCKEIHVLPYDDGSVYKNGKTKIKWVVKNRHELNLDK